MTMTTLDMEKGFQEIWKLFAETDKRFKDMEQRFKDLEKGFKNTELRFKDTELRFKDTDNIFKETAENLEKTDRKIDKLIGTWGTFVEGLVQPAAIRMFQERGIEVEEVSQNMKVTRKGQEVMEIDILLANGEYTVLIEVKTTLKVDDVKDHIERLSRFKQYFPRYADTKVIGAVAGIIIEEGVSSFAYKQGLFVIAQSGDMVKILNDEKFQPKEW